MGPALRGEAAGDIVATQKAGACVLDRECRRQYLPLAIAHADVFAARDGTPDPGARCRSATSLSVPLVSALTVGPCCRHGPFVARATVDPKSESTRLPGFIRRRAVVHCRRVLRCSTPAGRIFSEGEDGGRPSSDALRCRPARGHHHVVAARRPCGWAKIFRRA